MSTIIDIPFDGLNEDNKIEMSYYFGPNSFKVMKQYDLGLEEQIPLGGKLISWINKYIVINDDYKQAADTVTYYKQGYLTTDKACVVRVRIAGERAYITIKGENRGATRAEYEVNIDIEMAQAMLDTLCRTPIIEKTRYTYPHMGDRLFSWRQRRTCHSRNRVEERERGV